MDTIFLGAPTSTDERLQRVANASTGFLYLIARAGVTGERNKISESTRPLVERVRKITRLPLAVGFGLSTPQQVRSVQELADAAVVGSAIVRSIEEHFSTEGAAAIERWTSAVKMSVTVTMPISRPSSTTGSASSLLMAMRPAASVTESSGPAV